MLYGVQCDSLQTEGAKNTRGRSYLWRLSVRRPLLSECMVLKRHKASAAGGAEVWVGFLVWVESRRLQTHVAPSFLAEGLAAPETFYSEGEKQTGAYISTFPNPELELQTHHYIV